MEQKQVRSLNGFIECCLVLSILGCFASVVLTIIGLAEETTSVGAGVYGILANIVQGFFIVKIMGLHKIGVYGFLAMAAIDMIAAFIFSDGEYSAAFGVVGRDAFKAAFFLGCLFFLKKNGISGWDAIMKY